jgi:hypothetical protein
MLPLPKRRISLERIHDKLTGGKRFASVIGTGGNKNNRIRGLQLTVAMYDLPRSKAESLRSAVTQVS